MRASHKNLAGLLLFALAFAVSLTRVAMNRRELADPSRRTLRICHWQLEAGYRDAMDDIIREYERLHPDVRVMQLAVTERVYGQWVNTHLIAGTAPDIVELGMASLVNNEQYLARFFKTLTDHVTEPNPYNTGTELDQTAWRDTYIDGMAGGYFPDLQDYYGVPTTIGGIRIFYNRKLFREILGHDAPPRTGGQLLDVCERIRAYARAHGTELVPIAGSAYHSRFLFDRYDIPFTGWYEEALDTNLDGFINTLELYAGLYEGTIAWTDACIRAEWEFIRDLCACFQPGFMAVGREQSSFLFIQGQAAMIASGYWDALGLKAQARFDVGVFDFPLPARDERYGECVIGRTTEADMKAGGTFGINKSTRHPEAAIDFLQFLSSRTWNERFVKRVGFPPAIRGAEALEELRAFQPNPIGYSTGVRWSVGGTHANRVFSGKQWRYVQGEIPLEEMATAVSEAILNRRLGAVRDVWDFVEANRLNARNREVLAAVYAYGALTGQEPEDALRKLPAAHLNVALPLLEARAMRVNFERLTGERLEDL